VFCGSLPDSQIEIPTREKAFRLFSLLKGEHAAYRSVPAVYGLLPVKVHINKPRLPSPSVLSHVSWDRPETPCQRLARFFPPTLQAPSETQGPWVGGRDVFIPPAAHSPSSSLVAQVSPACSENVNKPTQFLQALGHSQEWFTSPIVLRIMMTTASLFRFF